MLCGIGVDGVLGEETGGGEMKPIVIALTNAQLFAMEPVFDAADTMMKARETAPQQGEREGK